ADRTQPVQPDGTAALTKSARMAQMWTRRLQEIALERLHHIRLAEIPLHVGRLAKSELHAAGAVVIRQRVVAVKARVSVCLRHAGTEVRHEWRSIRLEKESQPRPLVLLRAAPNPQPPVPHHRLPTPLR